MKFEINISSADIVFLQYQHKCDMKSVDVPVCSSSIIINFVWKYAALWLHVAGGDIRN